MPPTLRLALLRLALLLFTLGLNSCTGYMWQWALDEKGAELREAEFAITAIHGDGARRILLDTDNGPDVSLQSPDADVWFAAARHRSVEDCVATLGLVETPGGGGDGKIALSGRCRHFAREVPTTTDRTRTLIDLRHYGIRRLFNRIPGHERTAPFGFVPVAWLERQRPCDDPEHPARLLASRGPDLTALREFELCLRTHEPYGHDPTYFAVRADVLWLDRYVEWVRRSGPVELLWNLDAEVEAMVVEHRDADRAGTTPAWPKDARLHATFHAHRSRILPVVTAGVLTPVTFSLDLVGTTLIAHYVIVAMSISYLFSGEK